MEGQVTYKERDTHAQFKSSSYKQCSIGSRYSLFHRQLVSLVILSFTTTVYIRGGLSLPRRLGGGGICSQVLLFLLLLFGIVATGIAVVLCGRGSRLAQRPPLFEGKEERDEGWSTVTTVYSDCP